MSETAEQVFDRLPTPVYVTHIGEGRYVAQLATGQALHGFGSTVIEALQALEKKVSK